MITFSNTITLILRIIGRSYVYTFSIFQTSWSLRTAPGKMSNFHETNLSFLSSYGGAQQRVARERVISRATCCTLSSSFRPFLFQVSTIRFVFPGFLLFTVSRSSNRSGNCSVREEKGAKAEEWRKVNDKDATPLLIDFIIITTAF